MSFGNFVETLGLQMSDTNTTLAFAAIKYARHLGLPNVCSISSNVFTHGDLIFDPAEPFNQRYYNDPKSIVQIAPSVAKRSGHRHKDAWFDDDRKSALLDMLGLSVHAWLVFSVNPRVYGLSGHQVALTNQGGGYYDVWDTTLSYPNVGMNLEQVWDMCLGHMYGDRPIAITFN